MSTVFQIIDFEPHSETWKGAVLMGLVDDGYKYFATIVVVVEC